MSLSGFWASRGVSDASNVKLQGWKGLCLGCSRHADRQGFCLVVLIVSHVRILGWRVHRWASSRSFICRPGAWSGSILSSSLIYVFVALLQSAHAPGNKNYKPGPDPKALCRKLRPLNIPPQGSSPQHLKVALPAILEGIWKFQIPHQLRVFLAPNRKIQ